MTTTIKQKVTKVALMGAIALGCAGAATSAALVETAANPSIAHADQWQYSNGGWWLQTNNGYATGWKQIKGTWYYFDHNGWMKTGWQKIGGKWYNFGNDGAMITGWNKINYTWYHHDNSGVLQTGWIKLYSNWHYADSSGAIVTNWKKIGSKWYYFDRAVGAMQTGWQHIDNTWYYFNEDGAMQTGWYADKREGNWYFFNPSGAMKTGWNKIGSKWYYHNNSGVMQIGWQKINGKWYHFRGDGVMDSSKWIDDYYCQNDGSMATSQWVGEYYVNANGLWDGAKTNSNPTHIKTDFFELDLPENWAGKVSYTTTNNYTSVHLANNKGYELMRIYVTAAPLSLGGSGESPLIYQKSTDSGAVVTIFLRNWVEKTCWLVSINGPISSTQNTALSTVLELETNGAITLDQIVSDVHSYFTNMSALEYAGREIISTVKLRN